LPLQELAKAIEKVTYGKVDEYVKRAEADVKIAVRSRRRYRRDKIAA
jgi:hypothetical protein